MGAGLSPRRNDVDISPDRRDGHHAFDAEKPAPTMRGMGCAGVRCATGVGAGFPAMRFNPHARRDPRHGDHRINARETRPLSCAGGACEWLAWHTWQSADELAALLAEFIVYYNDRPHQGAELAGLSPNEYARQLGCSTC
jgi:hypothetical protein